MEQSQIKLNQIKLAIESLNEDIKSRLDKIKLNKQLIDDIFGASEKAYNSDDFVNSRLEENRQLLDLNRKAILFHTKLVKYYVDRLNGIESTIPEELETVILQDPEKAFELTLDGKLELDLNNPICKNKTQLEKLLRAFEAREEYEKCALIQQLLAA